MNQFHIHGLLISLIIKAQINLMRFLEEFKVIEMLCAATFNAICTFSFDTKCLHRTMETFMLCWFCKYNHIDKHLCDGTMQQIIFVEFKCGHLLHFEEVFVEEKAAYDKFKVCKLRINDFLSYVFALLFLLCFIIHVFFCMQAGVDLLEKKMWILELVCVMVGQKLLLLPWFKIPSLLVFLVLLLFLGVLLTSLLGLHLLATIFMLLLHISRKWFLKFLLLVLCIERRMGCKFQSLVLMDLDLRWILRCSGMRCLRKNCPSTRIA